MWRELRIVVPRGAVTSASAELFAVGAQGVQEDFLPGETPPPRQPWDTGAPPPLPDLQVLVAWFEDPDEADILAAAEELDLNSSALLIVWEDLWAAPLAKEILASGGQVIAGRRIPHQVVTEILELIEGNAS